MSHDLVNSILNALSPLNGKISGIIGTRTNEVEEIVKSQFADFYASGNTLPFIDGLPIENLNEVEGEALFSQNAGVIMVEVFYWRADGRSIYASRKRVHLMTAELEALKA